jgi:type III secretion protein U
VALAAGLAALVAGRPGLLGELGELTRRALASASTETRPPGVLLLGAAAEVARLAAFPMLAAAVTGAAAASLQTGGLLAPGLAAPRAERLHPGRGLARLWSGERLAAAGLGLLQAVLAGALLLDWVHRHAATLAALPGATAPAAALPALLGPLLLRLLLLLLVLGIGDLVLARRRLRRELAMSRDEVRRELREDEGDPQHRLARRRRHRALLEAGPVGRATCVLVNPTRVAVALRHERGGGEAPRVVAKGSGAAARRIRSQARRAGVPIVEDLPLARALHRLVEVGDEIPEPLFDAAATVLAHLYGAPGAGP